jgi:hypothetical protein
MIVVKVENYRSRTQMEKNLTSLLNDDWVIAAQSGAFSANPFGRMFPMGSPKVTVTLTRHRG